MFDRIKALWDKGAFHILVGNFVTKFVVFFGSIVAIKLLSKSEYGVLTYIENIYSYAYTLAGMGLVYVLLRYMVKEESREIQYGIFRHVVGKGILINIGIVLVICVGSFIYPHPADFSSARYLLPILLLTLPVQSVADDDLYTQRAMFSNKDFAVSSVIVAVGLLIGRYVGARYGGISGVVWLRVILNAIYAVVLTILVYRKYFKDCRKKAALSASMKKEMDLYAVQYMITNGFWSFFMLNDVFLLGRLIGDSTVVADYKVAYVLPGCVSIFSSAIGMFVAPYFAKNEDDKKWVAQNYVKVSIVNIAIMFVIMLGIIILAKPLVTVIYGEQYLTVIPTMNLLLISSFVNCGLRYMTANLLSVMGQVKYNLLVSVMGIGIQIILCFILIPQLGANGAAISSIITFFIMAVILFIIFARKYDLFHNVTVSGK